MEKGPGRPAVLDRVGNAPALDFVNTVHSRFDREAEDYLRSYGDLLEWARDGGLLSDSRRLRLRRLAIAEAREAGRTLVRAVELRETLYRIFLSAVRNEGPSTTDLATLNRWIAATLAHRRLEMSRRGFELAWDRGEASLEEPLWPVVTSAVELLAAGARGRLKQCPEPDGCGWLFLDTSKSGTRRWCSMRTCGNVSKARRHYRRRSVRRRTSR
jgi:predicted RNA-binding Zn ribbon-like protein